MGVEVDVDVDVSADVDAGTDMDADTDANADMGADVDEDIDAGAETEADMDAETNAGLYFGPKTMSFSMLVLCFILIKIVLKINENSCFSFLFSSLLHLIFQIFNSSKFFIYPWSLNTVSFFCC